MDFTRNPLSGLSRDLKTRQALSQCHVRMIRIHRLNWTANADQAKSKRVANQKHYDGIEHLQSVPILKIVTSFSMHFSIVCAALALNSHRLSERKFRPPIAAWSSRQTPPHQGIACVLQTKPSLGSRCAAQAGTLILTKRRCFLRRSVNTDNVLPALLKAH